METQREGPEAGYPKRAGGMSFFARKLANKLENKGVEVPHSLMIFMDTPVRAFDENQVDFFEQRICRLLPSFITALEEIFNDLGASEEGWEDMIDFCGKETTLIKICASAVLICSARKGRKSIPYSASTEQPTRKIQLPPQLVQT